jgi:hypothetical protein
MHAVHEQPSVDELFLPGEPDALNPISLRHRQHLGDLIVFGTFVGPNVQLRLHRLSRGGPEILL